jgi:hypothetical protein
MSLAPELSQSEFSSLAKIGTGPLLDVVVPAAHAMKLIGYRYIVAMGGRYQATTTGCLRIASGS